MAYKPTIGLEIHAELKTNSKMFCSCKNDPDEKRPNYNICPVCTAQPGTLPVANEEAIKKVIKTGLALNCTVSEDSKFDRKNYFYPDLPKGYQISQYDKPLCVGGYLEVEGRKIRITRIHLEEDTGSLMHPEGADYSLVNLNRAGVPLMELVTEPDISSGKEAREFAQELQLILKYLGVSDADMEKGQMRVEVNISISKGAKLGTKVEIKNLNSFKVVEKAVDFEIKRQEEVLEAGDKVVQETRGWHDKKEITFSQREKEEAHDYRYFPEPDLPLMHFDKDYVKEIKLIMLELPEQKRERFKKEYGLDNASVEFFVVNKDLSEYFEKVISEFDAWLEAEGEEGKKRTYKLVANYLISDVQGLLEGKEFVETEFKITPENFAEFVKMIYKNEISSKVAKAVLLEMFNTGVDPSDIVDDNNWRQMSDDSELEKIIKDVVAKNPKAVEDYKAGKQNSLQFLVGQVMAATRGTASPEKVRSLLKKII
ncbi:MAG: Asp-tRNA(Asn)/Glu-tRNA(Gln) amidotransferase subunit GatB [Candidatus Staskawiczbacteria bacterium]|nr:Asp-tRNA(Asn)/Glu-tRNA(Gln) amidotransferase subunit GatB [Candidatus Staskawiczbacteria bacterium]